MAANLGDNAVIGGTTYVVVTIAVLYAGIGGLTVLRRRRALSANGRNCTDPEFRAARTSRHAPRPRG